jgi:hypothetical protein
MFKITLKTACTVVSASILLYSTFSSAQTRKQPATSTFSCNITAFQIPGPTSSPGPAGINDNDTIVGSVHYDLSNTEGFIRQRTGQITTFLVPGNTNTWLTGINDKNVLTGNTLNLGFIDQNGNYTYPNYPGAVYTGVNGINNNGDVIGQWEDSSNQFQGYLLINGQYTNLQFPGGSNTNPSGLNDKDTVVGTFLDSSFTQHGFVYSAGKYQQVDFPGASSTALADINDNNEMVGWYWPAQGQITGMVYINGQFKSLVIPNASDGTSISAVNKLGHIAGVMGVRNYTDVVFLGVNCH